MNIRFRTFLRCTGLACLLFLSAKIAAQPSVQIVAPDTAECPGKLLQLEAVATPLGGGQGGDCLNCSFLWSDGYPSALRLVALPNSTNFSVTVTDPAGNTASDEHFITVLPGNFSVSLATDLGCADGQHSLTATPSGGSGNYTFWWDNGGGGASQSNLSAGTYAVTASDGNCQATAEATVEILPPFRPAGEAAFFGGNKRDIFNDMKSLPGGGFVAVGSSESKEGDLAANFGGSDAWVVRLDADLKVLWSRNYGGSSLDDGRKILALPDGGFLVAANTYSNDGDLTPGFGNSDWWIFRLDSLGNMLWQKRFGSTANDGVLDVAASPDGGFVLTGHVGNGNGDVSNFHGIFDVWVLKINAFGEKIWAKTWGGSQDDRGVCIAASPNGGCLVLASAESNNGDVTENRGQKDSWLLRFDVQGNLVWQKNTGGNQTETPVNFLWLPDSTIYLSCVSNSSTHDFATPPLPNFYRTWIFHLSSQGEILSRWSGDESLELHLAPAPDGGIFGVGVRNRTYLNQLIFNQSQQTPDEAVAFKFSPNRSLEWKNSFQIGEFDFVSTGLPLPGGKLALVGGTYRLNAFAPSQSGDAFFQTLQPAPPLAPIFLGNDTTVCAGQPVWLDATPLQGSGVACFDCTYLWNDGLPHPARMVSPTSTTTWTVTVTQPNGCSQIASRTVSTHPFDVSLTASDVACGAATNALTAVPTGANGAVQFSWSNGGTGNQISNLATGTYSVTATDGVCRVEKSASVGGLASLGFPLADPKIAWQRRLGSPGDDQIFSARPTSDGGFVLVGEGRADGLGDQNPSPHAVIFKLNAQGNLEWKTPLDPQDTLTSKAYDVVETPAGDFVLLAQKYQFTNPIAHFYRLDGQGAIRKTHSLRSGYVGKNVENNVNGRILGIASAMMEVDTAGSIKRDFELPGYQGHRPPFSFSTAPNGQMMLVFGTPPPTIQDTYYSSSNGGIGVAYRRLNEKFGQFDSDAFGGTADDVFETSLTTSDGSFVGAGWTTSVSFFSGVLGGKEAWVHKDYQLTANGIYFGRIYGGSGDDVAHAIIEDTDGGYLVAGSTRSKDGHVSKNHGGEDAWLFKLDKNGRLKWEKTFGGSGDDAFHSLRRLPDGSLLAAGRTNSTDGDLSQTQSPGGSDGWVVKLFLQPQLEFLGKDTTACAATDILLDATAASPGDSCFACTYLWNDGSTDPVRIVLPIFSTNYSVTVTHPNGCTATDNLQVTIQPAASNATLALSSSFACPKQEITLTATAPNCPECTFNWSPGVTPTGVGGGVGGVLTGTATAAPTASSTYSVTVTSPVGCSQTKSKGVIVHDLKINVLQSDCSATVQATGGTFGYNFTWDNGETDATITAPGEHSVTVSDGVCEWVEQVVLSPAQAPAVEWNLLANDLFSKASIKEVLRLESGDFMVVGDSVAAQNDRTPFAAKLTPGGKVVWKKTYPEAPGEVTSASLPSGFYEGINVTVRGLGASSTNRLLNIRFSDGKLHWNNESFLLHGSTKMTNFSPPTLCVGTTDPSQNYSWLNENNQSVGGDDLLLLRVGENGTTYSGTKYGGSKTDIGYDVRQSTGAIFVTGSTNSTDGNLSLNKGGMDLWVMKMTDYQTVLWSKTFGGSQDDAGFAVLRLPDSGCIVAGSTKSQDGDVGAHPFPEATWVLRLNSQGNVVWKKTFASRISVSVLGLERVRLVALANGNFLLSGAELIEMTPAGNVVWRMNNRLSDAAVAAAPDGSIVFETRFGEGLESETGLQKFKGFEAARQLLPDDLSYCHGYSLQIQPLPLELTGFDFVWSNGDTTLQPFAGNITADTSFILTAINPAGCSLSDTLNVSVLPHEDFYLSLPDTVCPKMSLQVLVQPSCPDCKYEWGWSQGVNLAGVAEPGFSIELANNVAFTVSVTDGNGCRQSVGKAVALSSLSVEIEGDLRCGEGASVLLAAASGGTISPSGVGGGGAVDYDFLWNIGGTTATLADVSNGNYSVTVSDGQCEVAADFEVEIDNVLPRASWRTKHAGHRENKVRVLDNQQGYEVGGMAGNNDKLRQLRFSKTGQSLDESEFGLAGTYRLLEEVPPGGSVLTNGGYVLGGGAGSQFLRDVRLKKITPSGTTVGGSLFTAGTPRHDTLTCILSTKNQGSAFAGMSLGASGFYDVFVGKTDVWGTVEWLSTFGNAWNDYATDLLEAPDGSFWLLGRTRQSGDPACSGDLWLLKINNLGELVQSHVFQTSGEIAAVSLHLDADNGLLILASKLVRSGSNNYRYDDAWILKVNDLGEIQWQTTIGQTNLHERPAAIFPAAGGGYFFWMERSPCSPEVYCQANTEGIVLKLDENGNELQRHSFGEAPYDVRETPDNGFIVNGYRYFVPPANSGLPGENEFRLVKFNFRDAPPPVELGNDTLLCPWETLPLDAAVGNTYIYSWSTGATSQTIVAHPGSYAVTVTDAKNCSRSDEITLTPCATFDLQGGNFCDTAAILLDASVPNAEFLWSTGSTEPTLITTQSGIYAVTVTFPATGFTMSDTAAIGIFQNNLSLESDLENPACFGDSTGVILLELTGSNGEPGFAWSNPGGFSAATEDLENLPAGTYFLTITDAGNCTLDEQFNLTQPAEIELFANVVNALCFGDSTGSIQATAAGSQAFSDFVWSNGVASSFLENVPAGSYSVTVTDVGGCTKSETWTISQPDSLTLEMEVSPPDTATGYLDLSATATGGTAPLSYAWNNGSTENMLENVPPGWYSLTVTDGNGCTATAQILAGETAAEEANGGFSLRLFPTPVWSVLTVEIASEVSGEAMLTVFDGLGRLVFSEEIKLRKSLQVKRLDVENWMAGAYFLELRSEQWRAGRMFLKVD